MVLTCPPPLGSTTNLSSCRHPKGVYLSVLRSMFAGMLLLIVIEQINHIAFAGLVPRDQVSFSKIRKFMEGTVLF